MIANFLRDISADWPSARGAMLDSMDALVAAINIGAPDATTVANLPTPPRTGQMVTVTDATSATAGTVVSGGGTHTSLVWYSGRTWVVVVGV